MPSELVDRITQAVMYEGYILYPYRAALKNRQRWTFGGVYPRAYIDAHPGSDRWHVQTQCLVVGTRQTLLHVKLRFLHLMNRTVGRLAEPVAALPDGREPQFQPVETLEVAGTRHQSWQEAVEREVELDQVRLADLQPAPQQHDFFFPGCRNLEPLPDTGGEIAGLLVREQQPLEGTIELSVEELADDLWRLTVGVFNRTKLAGEELQDRDAALLRSLVSTHTLLGVEQGEFVSLMDPPESLREFAAGCHNAGTWPVLVGEEGQTDTLLSAPIILYDYPQVAAESPGDLFDCTEIDEILSLRVMTLTDDEKAEARDLDPRGRSLVERTETLAREQLLGLHGTLRDLRPVDRSLEKGSSAMKQGWNPDADKRRLECVHVGPYELRQGDRVRLRPQGRADVFDMLLDGKTARIEIIEEDFDGRVHLAVTIDDDPGRDLGAQWQTGHRFFFSPAEVEPLGSIEPLEDGASPPVEDSSDG